ncbi:MAG TPA: hypothetical protein VIH35_06555 [Kiritimatiellia bacterium]|jgi:hypothetical protein
MARWISAAAFFLMTCTTPAGERPTFVVHYYPFTVGLVRTIARPEPDYMGWDHERMERDLQRLADACVDVVMVSVDPYEIRDPGRAEAYLDMVQHASKTSVEVAFMAEAHDAPRQDVDYFLNWCADELLGRRGYHNLDGRPLVEIYDALGAEDADHPALTVRHTVLAKQWSWGYAADDNVPLSQNGEQAMAFAGFMVNGDKPHLGFAMERENGARLERQLKAAIATGAKYICIASWNDFWEGHFIEPNSLDGTGPYDTLKRTLCPAKQD